jgi:hypothetical protein
MPEHAFKAKRKHHRPKHYRPLGYIPGAFREPLTSREDFDKAFYYFWSKRLQFTPRKILMQNWLTGNKEIPQQYEWAKIQVKEWIEKNIGRR